MENIVNPSAAVMPRAAASAPALVTTVVNGNAPMSFVPSWAHVSTPALDRRVEGIRVEVGNGIAAYAGTSFAAATKQGAPPRGEPR